MRGRDEETGEFLSPSRSQKRRDALAVFDLGEKLVELTDSQLAKVPMPDALRDLVRESRRITSPGARKRQLQFLAKHMRREEDDTLDAIRRALEHDRNDARRETAPRRGAGMKPRVRPRGCGSGPCRSGRRAGRRG